jgi:isocitrate dehydrogenase kinase/phosphatase
MDTVETRAGQELAQRIADVLLDGFERHYTLFRTTSAKAKQRFEDAAWSEAQQAVRERIRFYDDRVRECVERLHAEIAGEDVDDATWQHAKLLYVGMLVDYKRPELAETFFNSVITRMLGTTYAHNDFIFVRAAVSTEYIESDPPTWRSYYPNEGGLRTTLAQVFLDFGWTLPFADLERDVGHVMRALRRWYGGEWPRPEPNNQLQILGSAFYRNKAAYVVGKAVNGNVETPFIVPVLHDDEGRLVLDTVLLDADSISILFSLSRSYFMVDMDVPSGYVQFLRTVMPEKARADIYTAIGLGKQGKTLFVRDMLYHLHHSQDTFVEAPGTRGLVMHVFNLPSYPYVFKVIKDRFGPSKNSDRATVMKKFEMVHEVDRVGRMVDALQFKNLALPRSRFAPELLEQLTTLAASVIELDGDNVIVRHCYVERRLIPLNMYVETATTEQIDHVVREYGDAIRELAIANIFPGDMLWRNFGVNRQGRVVFYDYDEIEYLTDCSFRAKPAPPTPEAELSDEVWYAVGERDIFPEEFESFLLGSPKVREAFLRHHSELLHPEFWQECQRRVVERQIVDFFPYPEAVRFCHQPAGVA